MRKDLGFYVEADIASVYTAYLKALSGDPFRRSCNEQPYHTLSFGLNFSMKYNMNGGSCHIHFMPYGSGTAVNIRFSIAQAAGARYGKYAEVLNNTFMKYLPVQPRPANYNMDDFLRPENQVVASSASSAFVASAPVAQAPVATPAPAPASAPLTPPPVAASPAVSAIFCSNCGNKLDPSARFCTQCGTPLSKPKVCPSCNAPAKEKDLFCSNCGTRL